MLNFYSFNKFMIFAFLLSPLSAFSESNNPNNILTPDFNDLTGYNITEVLRQNKKSQRDVLKMLGQVKENITPDLLENSLNLPTALENPNAQAKGVFVLVSLTMPNVALEQLLQQSMKYQIPLVIRGVLPTGFKDTVFRINQLLTKGGKRPAMNSGISINPNWFTQFNIKQVPAFVSVKEGRCLPDSICSSDDFDILYGNISMEDALNILSKGDAKDNAISILNRGI